MSTSTPSRPRKKGAQPGNKNALKHGFYSRAFRVSEDSLQTLSGPKLDDEILLLRVIINRVAVLCKNESNPDRLLRLLDSLGAAMVRLASLFRTEHILSGKSGSAEQIMTNLLRLAGVSPDPSFFDGSLDDFTNLSGTTKFDGDLDTPSNHDHR